MTELDNLFDRLWRQYTTLNPEAARIHALFEERGETVQNDHVAFRTFADDRVGIEVLAKPFLELGYKPADTYRFEEKKLFARYYAHEDPKYPKVFISELLLQELSSELQSTVRGLIDQVTDKDLENPELLTSGRLWNVDSATYERLHAESEYAGWMSAFGFCANHFTVYVNDLNSFDNIEDLAVFLMEHGFRMNQSGGLIKGSPDVFLEQCSTMATHIEVPFTDGSQTIPSCYYEFAKRYTMPAGGVYQGFVASSADKIFESTNRS
ncbi:DUF1338 domain-containing protein [Parvularcula sp. LCG005]|uniref:DUF1338 domain-containing protein n=1 Tax=Parvularcula sp. LCG005 TaxID=3078805 RepID=UPI00294270E0|nr:DUF1338 domain-containing protein [Parvularcula sp. LCG005]WOI52324.1 DUF1338 domain-containing protein [Parvularcula sp. LCG005]